MGLPEEKLTPAPRRRRRRAVAEEAASTPLEAPVVAAFAGDTPVRAPRGRRGTTAMKTRTRTRLAASLPAVPVLTASVEEPTPAAVEVRAPAPAEPFDEPPSRQRGRRWPGRPPSRTLLPIAGLAFVIASAAYVRYVGLAQVGFNSDEAVYSGQAAAIAGFQPYGELFGVFRAHPLLVQFVVALGYAMTEHVSDSLPRAVTAFFGVAFAVTCWGIGSVIRGRFLGFAMGMLAALCPYEVIVSRQMLLDGPMTTFVAVTMLMVALWLRTTRVAWFYAAAATAALAVLSKEMGMLTVPAVVLFLLFSRDLPLRWRRDIPIAAAVFAVAISPYPLSLILGGGAHTTNQFIVWQFFRQPNHDALFYLTVLPSFGYVTLALAAIGFASLRWRWQPFDTLAVTLVLCNVAFFEIWPTKGFEYLLPIAPAIVYMAGRGAIALGELAPSLKGLVRLQHLERRWAAALALAFALVSMAPPAVQAAIRPVQTGAAAEIATDSDLVDPAGGGRVFLAGTGGLQASRPAGEWIRHHTLPSARFLTIGPSFANVIQFYGQRKALALSVSANPLHRNPQYEPVVNADSAIRSGSIQYLVFDSYSASRSKFFAQKLMSYVNKFDGVAVFVYREETSAATPDVVIFEVHP